MSYNKILQIFCIFIVDTLCNIQNILALDNGLALTPPMGFMTWQRYRCITDCNRFPDECISDRLIRRIADKMVSEGYKSAGYEYLIIDDCWLAKERSANGMLQADKSRFPYGIKPVADYVHEKGLKFGIYEDYGNKTCGGYPGILGHLEEDAKLFAEWGTDYIKIDGCYSVPYAEMPQGYAEFGNYLNKTGRPMVYSCSWPAYFQEASIPLNYPFLKKYCNLWRNYNDIQDSFESLTNIMDWFALTQESHADHAGPGHWNDPDMLLIGNYGLSYDQAKTQMAVWAILAAPLLISADLNIMRPEFKEILLNREIIEINQDPLGIQGRRILRENHMEIWIRPITPKYDEESISYALAIISRRDDGAPYAYNVTLKSLGLKIRHGFYVRDLYEPHKTKITFVKEDSFIPVRINPSGCMILKLTAALPTQDTTPLVV